MPQRIVPHSMHSLDAGLLITTTKAEHNVGKKWNGDTMEVGEGAEVDGHDQDTLHKCMKISKNE